MLWQSIVKFKTIGVLQNIFLKRVQLGLGKCKPLSDLPCAIETPSVDDLQNLINK